MKPNARPRAPADPGFAVAEESLFRDLRVAVDNLCDWRDRLATTSAAFPADLLVDQGRLRAADQRDALVLMNLAFRGGRDAEAVLADLRKAAAETET